MHLLRSQSDMESGRIRTSPAGHLTANRNDIFARTPAMTKEMLQKLQNAEIGPKKAHLCGYEFNTRQISILIALFLLFSLSSGFTYTFWCTNRFREVVLEYSVISNTSKQFANFLDAVPSQTRIYIYNYTNVNEVATRTEAKLKVQELGPWVYEDRLHRRNVTFSEDGTYVRFRETHSYKFIPELSTGLQLDKVTVPNIPMLTGAAMFRRSYFLTRLGMSTIFKQLNAQPFVTVAADRFILGYDDELFTLARNMMALTKSFPIEKFGLLATRKNSPDWVEVWTGKDDINKLGTTKSINDKVRLNNWDDDDMDSVAGGVDGVAYPPNLVHNKQKLNMFYKDLCRKVPLEFVEETKILGGTLPAYKYEVPVNAFAHPSMGNPENQAYCTSDGECAPHGLWNVTKCAYGTPIFVSYPHFFGADPKYREAVDGVSAPIKEKHSSQIEFHPYMGFIMQGWNRLQTNIQVQKSFGITELGMFEDDVILPVAWMEFGARAEDQPDYILDVFNEATYFVNNLEMAFKFGPILMMLVTAIGFFIVLTRNRVNKVANVLFMENVS